MKDYREIKDLKYEILVCVDNAYKKGYTQGQQDRDKEFEKGEYEFYQKGLDDAWECAKWLAKAVLGEEASNTIFKGETVEGALKKKEEYKNKYKFMDIVVGDEVYNLDPENKRIVTSIYVDERGNKQAVQMVHNGKYGCDRIETLTKTGRHFDEIEKILDQMRAKE